MPTAYSYKRFSSPKQAKGDSLRRQTEFEQQVIQEMGLELDESLCLTDAGVSAFRGANRTFGVLAAFIRLVEAGRIEKGSVLLVENLDRLSRENVSDAYDLFNSLIRAGVVIVTASPREVYSRETVANDFSKIMVALLFMVRAHDESLQKSRRVRAAWERRKRAAREEGKPLTRRCPAWLRVVKGRYELIPDRVETIRLLYSWVLAGMGLHTVTRRLVDEGRRPFGRTARWNEAYVRKLLTSPTVHGEMQTYGTVEGKKVPEGTPLPDYYPAVVDKEQFQVVQAAMSRRRRKSGRPATGDGNLFTGLAYDARSGERMCLINSGASKGKRFTYLTSGDVRRGRTTGRGRGRSVRYEFFEQVVIDAIPGLVVQEPSPEQAARAERQVKLAAQIFRFDERLARMIAQSGDSDSEMSADAFMAAVNEMTRSKRALQTELNELLAEEARASLHSAEGRSASQVLASLLPGQERDEVRQALKVRIGWLVDELWLLIEPVGRRDTVLYVQLQLRDGTRKVVKGSTTPARPPSGHYDEVDFRTYFRPAGEAGECLGASPP